MLLCSVMVSFTGSAEGASIARKGAELATDRSNSCNWFYFCFLTKHARSSGVVC